MTITIDEKAESLSTTDGESVQRIYVIQGTDSDTEAMTALKAEAPATYLGLIRKKCRIEPLGGGVWIGIAPYARPGAIAPTPLDVGESAFTFSTGGATMHLTQAISHIAGYHKTSETAPDFKGAIGVTEDGVEGVDVGLRAWRWSETHVLADADVDDDYKRDLWELTYTVNSAPFKGHAAGEALFMGADGSKRGDGDWEIAFAFAGSPKEGMSEGFGVNCYDANNAPFLRIWEFAGDTYSASLTINSDTLYYATVSRSGTTATLQVFTDAARTSQVGTDRTLTVTTDAKRYLLAFTSAGSSWNPTHTATGWVRKFDLGEGEIDLRLFDETDPGDDLTTMPTISVGQTFTNGSVSADLASPAPVQQVWSGSAPWSDTLKIIMAAAAAQGLSVHVDGWGAFEGGFAGWNGMHLWHEWNTGLNHWDQITWEGEQHHDEDFFDELMAYGDAFAGTWAFDIWRWYQGMADFTGAMHDYTGRRICLLCTCASWWFDTEFAEEPRATATPEVYGYHLGSGGDEAYKAYIDYITTSEEQSLWNASQGICHQGDPWLVDHGSYGGQITWDRLVYAHDAGIRGEWLIYTDDDEPFWDLDILAATQSFEQARTDLINMLAEFNATYGMIPGRQPGPGAWYL